MKGRREFKFYASGKETTNITVCATFRSKDDVFTRHRSRIRYLSKKKFANFNEFSEIKKIRKNS